jgi:hypothetical protein
MPRLERPQIKLKLEVTFPSVNGEISKKFSTSRTLKARWNGTPQETSQQILDEIKNYKGSFLGDMIVSLFSLVKSDGEPLLKEGQRANDIAKYTASVVDSLIYAGIRDKLHEEALQNTEVIEYDGMPRDIGPITSEELLNSDIEKVITLLTPKIKYAITMLSKTLNKTDFKK